VRDHGALIGPFDVERALESRNHRAGPATGDPNSRRESVRVNG
jgi:hypothetical protein